MSKVIHFHSSKRMLILGIVLLLLLTFVQIASATTTPQVCDDAVKYWCSKVTYNSQSGSWNITDRFYKGGIDGGADWWQYYWIKDLHKINGNWAVAETWSYGPTHTNILLSSWYSVGTDRLRVYMSMVQYKFRYYECSMDGSCGHWCSETSQHQLWNNQSDGFSDGICTG